MIKPTVEDDSTEVTSTPESAQVIPANVEEPKPLELNVNEDSAMLQEV